MNTPPPEQAPSVFPPSPPRCNDDDSGDSGSVGTNNTLSTVALSHKATAYSVAALVNDEDDTAIVAPETIDQTRRPSDGRLIADAFRRVQLGGNDDDENVVVERRTPSDVVVPDDVVAESSPPPPPTQLPPAIAFEPVTYSQDGKARIRCGAVEVTLDNLSLWDQFKALGTEMIITKAGRRMFPPFVISIDGMDPTARYTLFMDVEQVDDKRYKYLNSKWIEVGKAEKETEPRARYVHPESPNTGQHWMTQKVSFKKMKLTNNKKNTSGHLVLNSMHKYQPRIHVMQEGEGIDDDQHAVFVFPDTVFIAVTAYQNDQVTQLKIDNNPFAKAFRDSPQDNDPRRGGAAWPQGYYHTSYPSQIQDGHFFAQDYAGHLRYSQVPQYYPTVSPLSPWENAFNQAYPPPVTPNTPYQRPAPDAAAIAANWQYEITGGGAGNCSGGVATTLPSSTATTEEPYATTYAGYGFGAPAQASQQVPLTPLTPSMDPYAACNPYVAAAVAAAAQTSSSHAFATDSAAKFQMSSSGSMGMLASGGAGHQAFPVNAATAGVQKSTEH